MSITAVAKEKHTSLTQSSLLVTPKARRSFSLEAELYTLLQHLAPPDRRAVLQREFAESQRLALEQWILARRHQIHREKVTISKACSRSRSGIFGIETHLRKDRLLYRAGARVGPFRLSTGYTQDLAVSCRQLAALRRICKRVKDATSLSVEGCVETRLRKALAEESPAVVLQLRFFATLPGLKTPSFRIVGGLEAGLRAWRRLGQACNPFSGRPASGEFQQSEKALAEVQRVYTEVWAEASRGCTLRAGAQLKALNKFSSRVRSKRKASVRMLFSPSGFVVVPEGDNTGGESMTQAGALLLSPKGKENKSVVTFEAKVKRRIGALLKRWLKNDALTLRAESLCKSKRYRT